MRFRLWVAVAFLLFSLGIVGGMALPASGVVSAQTGALRDLARMLDSLPQWAVAAFIFLKNLSAIVFGFALSPFFLLVPALSLVLNGWVVGAVGGGVIADHSIAYFLAGTLPHGILELPAFFIGQAAAFAFGVSAMKAVISRKDRGQLAVSLKSNLRYLALAVGLLVPAALVETFVTPWLLTRFV